MGMDKKRFVEYLNRYGTDYSYIKKTKNFSGTSYEDLSNMYVEHLAEKADYVNFSGRESTLSLLCKIFRKGEEDDSYYSEAEMDGTVGKSSVKLELDDYRLPFLLKDREYFLKQQLTYIWEIYEMMLKGGAIERDFINQDWARRIHKNIGVNSDKRDVVGVNNKRDVVGVNNKRDIVDDGNNKRDIADDSNKRDVACASDNKRDIAEDPCGDIAEVPCGEPAAIVTDEAPFNDKPDECAASEDLVNIGPSATAVSALHSPIEPVQSETSCDLQDSADLSVIAFEKFNQRLKAVISGTKQDEVPANNAEHDLLNGSSSENSSDVKVDTQNDKVDTEGISALSGRSRTKLNINKAGMNKNDEIPKLPISNLESTEPEAIENVKRVKIFEEEEDNLDNHCADVDLLNELNNVLSDIIHVNSDNLLGNITVNDSGNIDKANNVDNIANNVTNNIAGSINEPSLNCGFNENSIENHKNLLENKEEIMEVGSEETKNRSFSEYLSVSRFLKSFKQN